MCGEAATATKDLYEYYSSVYDRKPNTPPANMRCYQIRCAGEDVYDAVLYWQCGFCARHVSGAGVYEDAVVMTPGLLVHG